MARLPRRDSIGSVSPNAIGPAVGEGEGAHVNMRRSLTTGGDIAQVLSSGLLTKHDDITQAMRRSITEFGSLPIHQLTHGAATSAAANGMARSLSAGALAVDVSHCGRPNLPDEEVDLFFPWAVVQNFEGRKLIAALDTSMHKTKPWLKRQGRVGAAMIDPDLPRAQTAPPNLNKGPIRKNPRWRPISNPHVRGAFPLGKPGNFPSGKWVPTGPVGTGIPHCMTISRERKGKPPIGTPGIELQEEMRPHTYLHPYCVDRHGRTNWAGNRGKRAAASEAVGSVFDQLRPPNIDAPEYHEWKLARIKSGNIP